MAAVALAPEVPVLVLESSDQAPAQARRFLVERFTQLGVADDFVGRLVVTELVTNSYKHVGIGHIIVRIFRDERDGLVVIEVWDEGAGLPVVRPEDHDALDARGLLMMTHLVREWGVRPLNEKGKIVWAKCTP